MSCTSLMIITLLSIQFGIYWESEPGLKYTTNASSFPCFALSRYAPHTPSNFLSAFRFHLLDNVRMSIDGTLASALYFLAPSGLLSGFLVHTGTFSEPVFSYPHAFIITGTSTRPMSSGPAEFAFISTGIRFPTPGYPLGKQSTSPTSPITQSLNRRANNISPCPIDVAFFRWNLVNLVMMSSSKLISLP